MACQPIWGYFTLRRKETIYLVNPRLHSLCGFFRIFAHDYMAFSIAIKYNSFENKSILTVTKNPGHGIPGSNGNVRVIHTPHIFKDIGVNMLQSVQSPTHLSHTTLPQPFCNPFEKSVRGVFL